MGRKQTGLRNRFRNGRGNYSKRGKGPRSDRYGTYSQGRIVTSESIAGRTINDDLPSARRES